MADLKEKSFLENAIADGHTGMNGEGGNERMQYNPGDYSECWDDPGEKVDAGFSRVRL